MKNNCYDKAIDIIRKASKNNCCNNCVGPTGPRGPVGPIRNFVVGMVNEGNFADVTIEENGMDEIINFTLPKGPKGDDGSSIRILGSYNNYDDLIMEHPTGNIGDGYLVNEDLFVWSDNDNNWTNVGKIKGPKGDDGPNKIKVSHLVTFNDNVNYTGTLINFLVRIPIGRKELDIDNLINLNTNNNTMLFNLIGYYKITFIVNARILTNDNFNPDNDFISLGLRLIDTDNIYIGASKWIYNKEYNTITGQEILAVNGTNNIMN